MGSSVAAVYFLTHPDGQLERLTPGEAFVSDQAREDGDVVSVHVTHPPNWADAYTCNDFARFLIYRFDPQEGGSDADYTAAMSGPVAVVRSGRTDP